MALLLNPVASPDSCGRKMKSSCCPLFLPTTSLLCLISWSRSSFSWCCLCWCKRWFPGWGAGRFLYGLPPLLSLTGGVGMRWLLWWPSSSSWSIFFIAFPISSQVQFIVGGVDEASTWIPLIIALSVESHGVLWYLDFSFLASEKSGRGEKCLSFLLSSCPPEGFLLSWEVFLPDSWSCCSASFFSRKKLFSFLFSLLVFCCLPSLLPESRVTSCFMFLSSSSESYSSDRICFTLPVSLESEGREIWCLLMICCFSWIFRSWRESCPSLFLSPVKCLEIWLRSTTFGLGLKSDSFSDRETGKSQLFLESTSLSSCSSFVFIPEESSNSKSVSSLCVILFVRNGVTVEKTGTGKSQLLMESPSLSSPSLSGIDWLMDWITSPWSLLLSSVDLEDETCPANMSFISFTESKVDSSWCASDSPHEEGRLTDWEIVSDSSSPVNPTDSVTLKVTTGLLGHDNDDNGDDRGGCGDESGEEVDACEQLEMSFFPKDFSWHEEDDDDISWLLSRDVCSCLSSRVILLMEDVPDGDDDCCWWCSLALDDILSLSLCSSFDSRASSFLLFCSFLSDLVLLLFDGDDDWDEDEDESDWAVDNENNFFELCKWNWGWMKLLCNSSVEHSLP